MRRAVLMGAALTLAVPAVAQARDVHALDDQGNLLRVDSRYPGVVLDEVAISGLPAGVRLVGIDIRSTTNTLVGAGTDNVMYQVNQDTGAATPIGSGFNPGLVGASFGVDVNPVPDAMRVTSDSNMNYRLSFASGDHGAGSPDGALNPGSPQVVASAYTNTDLTVNKPAGTRLFGIDRNTDQLLSQNPPNAGTLVDAKSIGVDVGSRTGFDIADGIGYMSTNVGDGAGTKLFRIDLNTGAATELGPIGTGRLVRKDDVPSRTVTAIAVRQPAVGPPAVNMPPNVTIVATTPSPKPKQNAAYIAQANDPDGAIVKVEWDRDGDGTYDISTGAAQRIPLDAGRHVVRVRATDNLGARAVATLRVTAR
ncbi:MAG: DUF4394 domain-containing protein [Miltoncostaeaceae bacterium]